MNKLLGGRELGHQIAHNMRIGPVDEIAEEGLQRADDGRTDALDNIVSEMKMKC